MIGLYLPYQYITLQLMRSQAILYYRRTNMKRTRWTIEKLQAEADKYDNVKDFIKNSPNAYRSAKLSGLFSEIARNLKNNSRIYWTTELLQKEALKYKTKVDRKSTRLNSSHAN